MNDISCTIIEAIANVACDKSCSEKVKAYRIEALNSIHQQICFYQKEGFTSFSDRSNSAEKMRYCCNHYDKRRGGEDKKNTAASL